MKKEQVTKNIIFKVDETEETLRAQLKQNPLFKPLLGYFHKAEIEQLLQDSKEQQFTIAELKKILNYDIGLDKAIIMEQELKILTDLLKDNEKITLKMPCLIKLDKKNLKKLLRIDKYYNQSVYLFKKFSSDKITRNKEFLLPFLQIPVLLALLQILPDEYKITVNVLEKLNPLINQKSMLAIAEKIREGVAVLPDSATLVMSEECNLRCVYCYEPQQKRDQTVLTFEKAKQILRKFNYKSKITFFGGEPMLHIDLMKQICEWGWEYRNFEFELITNGQIVDRDFLRNYVKYFSYVQLSIDGPQEPQEIGRGHGSFRRAMQFFNACLEETGRPPSLHPVLCKYSIPYLFDTIKWFYDMEKINIGYSLRWLPGDAQVWTEEDFEVYAEQLLLIKNWYLKNNIRETSFSIRAFAQAEKNLLGIDNQENSPLRDEEVFCSAGRSLMAVLPTGKMVPCHHEYWCSKEAQIYEEIDLDEDSPGINHMSELCLKDIPECNSCPQWGCCVCPGSFFFQSQSYTKPDKNWCRAGKMLIETAKNYIEELAQNLNDNQHKVDYLAAGMDYFLEQERERLKL